MAVLQRVAFYPNERFDTPDARSLEGFALNDWRYFVLGVMSDKSYVLRGFDIKNYSTLFSISGFKLEIDNVVMFHPEATKQSAGFYVYAGSEPDTAVTLSPNATNFVEADFSVESAVPDIRAFWDQAANPPNGGEFTDTVDTVINLTVAVTSNISGFTSGKVPLYKVVTDINGVATSVTDCRNLFFRLGKGGTTPNADYDFVWPSLPDAAHSQFEAPATSTAYASGNAPWQGGDKNLHSFKDWMDAVMSSLKEIKGVPYWYMPGGGGGGLGITGAYQNAALTVLQNGTWEHDQATLGTLILQSGSKVVRLGFANDPILSAFSGIDLTTNKALYVILPKTDTAVSYGMGEDGTTPVSPKAISTFSATSISVALGGNYETSGGNIMVRGQEFAYTSYTPGTGLFSGVTPDPSGLVQVGDDVYALNASGVGYYHYSATAKVPGKTSPNVSEGAERVIWLGVYNGTDMISLKNGDLIQGEQIDVGDNTSINLLEYIGAPSDAATIPNYAGTALSGAKTGQSSYGASSSDDLTVRVSKLTQMMADKAQDKTIQIVRRNIVSIDNTTNGSAQEITMSSGSTPTIEIVVPGSADIGVITCTGTLSLLAGQAAYVTINRNAAFTVANLGALTVANISAVPIAENVFIFAYRLSDSRVYLYDAQSLYPGSYPGETDLQRQVVDRIGVNEIGFNPYTSTTVIAAGDSYDVALSKLDQAVGSVISDTQIEENILATLNQTNFTFSTITFAPSNTNFDLKVYRNGRKMSQDPAGGLSEDFRKTSNASIEFAYGLRLNDKVTGRMERQSSVAISAQPYFINYVTSQSGTTIPTVSLFNTGTDKLSVYENGVLLFNSPSLGTPADRYQEAGTTAVVLGSNAQLTDVFTILNEDTLPNFRQFSDGLTGTTLTVPAYTMGDDTLRVYRNGVLMNAAGLGAAIDQYTEASSTSITLATASVMTDVWCFHSMSVVPDYRSDVSGLTGTTLTVPTYTMGDKRLLVFRNGILMLNSLSLGAANDRYQEATTTTLTLADAAVVGDVFTYIYK